MTVLANIGVPMIFGQVSLMAFALVPIVVVECYLGLFILGILETLRQISGH